jgi:hypothetical protein
MRDDEDHAHAPDRPGALRGVFSASSPFVLFDYFRVPYEVAPAEATNGGALAAADVEVLRSSTDSSRALYWIRPDGARGAYEGKFQFGSQTLLGRVGNSAEVEALLGRLGGRWEPNATIRDAQGREIAAIWGDDNGRLLLPFDPNDLIVGYWSERHFALVGSGLGRDARSAALRAYYRLRPLIPRRAQIAARRVYSRAQATNEFPRWPIEPSLHDLYDFLFASVAALVDEPVPFLAPWPGPYRWAFVLSHDVETADGYGLIKLLRGIEADRDYRSAWYFVPKNHSADADRVLDGLRADGCEIGVHGLYHDGRDIAKIDERLPQIGRYATDWNAVGFRSPATLRDWHAMARLPFEYDSSYSDTAPYEPQPGGCGSLLPYMIGPVVELPITLPQDHTLFEILGGADDIWRTKARFIRERGGMALVLTHPDYAANDKLRQGYSDLLGEFHDDETAWKVLPREVSGWWLRRSASRPSRAEGDWVVAGPAAGLGRVAFVAPRPAGDVEPTQVGRSQSSRHHE